MSKKKMNLNPGNNPSPNKKEQVYELAKKKMGYLISQCKEADLRRAQRNLSSSELDTKQLWESINETWKAKTREELRPLWTLAVAQAREQLGLGEPKFGVQKLKPDDGPEEELQKWEGTHHKIPISRWLKMLNEQYQKVNRAISIAVKEEDKKLKRILWREANTEIAILKQIKKMERTTDYNSRRKFGRDE